MYEAREQADILQELQAASGTPASKIEGTFENDMLAANSLEFAKVEVELEQAYKAAFAETSWGDYLTMIAAQFGVDRKRAGKAKGTVTVTGTGSVSKGSRFATAAGVLFVATQNVDAVGSADIPVEARHSDRCCTDFRRADAYEGFCEGKNRRGRILRLGRPGEACYDAVG